MSIYGLTKGTELDFLINCAMRAEENGGVRYYMLSRLAEEQKQALIDKCKKQADDIIECISNL